MAHAVLTDLFLFAHITQFQGGLPCDVVELARAQRANYPPYELRQGMFHPTQSSLLPLIAIKQHDLALLQRLYKICREQPALQSDYKYMSFRCVWRDSLRYGDDATVEWVNAQPDLCDHVLEELHDISVGKCIAAAIQSRKQGRLVWLLTVRPGYKDHMGCRDLEDLVSVGNQLSTFQWLEQNIVDLPYSREVMDAACVSGCLELVRYLHETRPEGCTSNAMMYAARFGGLEVVKFLHENRTEGCDQSAMDLAASSEHLDIVRFLHENRTEGCTTRAMDLCDNLELIRFFHENRTEGCTTAAMDRAAGRGDMEAVRFLQENRTEGCSKKAMVEAAGGGHLEMIRFLHDVRGEPCSRDAMHKAARNGHLEVLRQLFQWTNRRRTELIDEAAAQGHAHVIQFLKEQGVAVTYPSAMVAAAKGGHLEILQQFIAESPESLPSGLIDVAARGGHLPVVQYLHSKGHPHECTQLPMEQAALQDHLPIVRYFFHNCDQPTGSAIRCAAIVGNLRMVQLLVELRTDGCLLYALQIARRFRHTMVEEYLAARVNPAMTSDSEAHQGCRVSVNRLCGKP